MGSLLDCLELNSVAYRLLRPYAGESIHPPSPGDAAVVLGGAMGVHDDGIHPFLREVKGYIAACTSADVPLLGICLGGQLLAEVLGGKVASVSHAERGVIPISLTEAGRTEQLFEGIPSTFLALQWHNDSFTPPPGKSTLAYSAICPHQAFRSGSAYGLQFHPEATADIVATWCRTINGNPPLSAAESSTLMADFATHQTACYAAAQKLFGNFLRIAALL